MTHDVLTQEDLRSVVEFMPRDLRDLMKEHNLVLGGGYIRSRILHEPASDIDLFGPDKGMLGLYAKALQASRRDSRLYNTRNAYTVLAPNYAPVQFITRWLFNSPEDLIDSFDFTIARAAVWFDGEEWKSIVDRDFYHDLAGRRLRYMAPNRHEDAGGSLLRALKFAGKGFHISPESFGRVVARLISGVEEDSPMWKGRESDRARVITGLLRKVDPLTVIDGLMPSDDSMEVTAQ